MLRYRCCAAHKSIAIVSAFALTAAMFPAVSYAAESTNNTVSSSEQVSALTDSSSGSLSQGSASGANADSVYYDSSVDANSQKFEIEAIAQTPNPAANMLAADVYEGDIVVQQDGLNFLISADNTATFIGWSTLAPEGSLQIPNSVRVAGQDIPVAALSFRLQQTENQEPTITSDQQSLPDSEIEVVSISTAASWLAACDEVESRMTAPGITSIVIPHSIVNIDTASLSAFPNAKAIVVDAANPVYKSYNGMLFNSDLTSLLLCPRGMEGNAVLPEDLASVPACVFSRCTKLSAISLCYSVAGGSRNLHQLTEGGTANSTFYAQDGLLYKKNTDTAGSTDGTLTLVAAPSAVGVSVRLMPECIAIAEGALWGCSELSTIQAPGIVNDVFAGLAVDPNDSSLLFAVAVPDAAATLANAAIPSSDTANLTFAQASPYLYEVHVTSNDDESSVYYSEVPAFAPSIALNATVITENEAPYRTAWENAGFSNFATTALLPNSPEESTDSNQGGVADSDESVEQPSSSPDASLEATEAIDGSGFSFKMLPNGTLSVAWGSKENAPSELEIPDSGIIDGLSYTVSKIADKAFVDQPDIAIVKLPMTITEIGESAFARCKSLRSIALNSGLKFIGEDAFRTSGLEGIVIPDGMQYIGSKAFGDLKDTDIVAPAQIPYVNENVLSGSTGVHVYVPYNATENYVWNTGIIAAGNRLCPYGVRINPQALSLQPGETVDLFAGDGYIFAPGDVKVVCTYNAGAVSIDTNTGTITGIQSGNADVKVSLSMPVDKTSISRQIHQSAQTTNPTHSDK